MYSGIKSPVPIQFRFVSWVAAGCEISVGGGSKWLQDIVQ